MKRCKGDFDFDEQVPGDRYKSICGWSGTVEECILLNGEPICPKCGSSVEEVEECSDSR